MFIVAMIVGLMEVSPGVCQMELLNPNKTINTSKVPCEYFVTREEVTTDYGIITTP